MSWFLENAGGRSTDKQPPLFQGLARGGASGSLRAALTAMKIKCQASRWRSIHTVDRPYVHFQRRLDSCTSSKVFKLSTSSRRLLHDASQVCTRLRASHAIADATLYDCLADMHSSAYAAVSAFGNPNKIRSLHVADIPILIFFSFCGKLYLHVLSAELSALALKMQNVEYAHSGRCRFSLRATGRLIGCAGDKPIMAIAGFLALSGSHFTLQGHVQEIVYRPGASFRAIASLTRLKWWLLLLW
jgi:hypothetical protein